MLSHTKTFPNYDSSSPRKASAKGFHEDIGSSQKPKAMIIKGDLKPELRILKNLLYTTVRIVTKKKDKKGIGTGFFFNFPRLGDNNQPYTAELLFTNKHVAKDAEKAWLVFHLGRIANGAPSGEVFEFEIDGFERKIVNHPDPKIDLCALDISPFLSEVEMKTGKSVYYQALTVDHILFEDDLKEMFPITDVYMVGYPKGLWDKKNNLPITRKGVTASHPYYDFNAKSQGAVDIAVINGSSGSPIISYQFDTPTYDEPWPVTFKLLGVLWGGTIINGKGKPITVDVPSTVDDNPPITKMPIHLGYYIKSKELMAFETLF